MVIRTNANFHRPTGDEPLISHAALWGHIFMHQKGCTTSATVSTAGVEKPEILSDVSERPSYLLSRAMYLLQCDDVVFGDELPKEKELLPPGSFLGSDERTCIPCR